MAEERRWAIVAFETYGAQSLVEILRGRVIARNMPPDARVVRIGYEPQTDELLLVLSSDTFALVPRGSQLPRFDLVLERLPGAVPV